FVPASGAASRMFQALFNFLEKATTPDLAKEEITKDKGFNSVSNFFSNLRKFAFYKDLQGAFMDNGDNLEERLVQKEYTIIIEWLLTEKGLNYGKLPKGLLRFHSYPNGERFSFEEHLIEAIRYGKSEGNDASIHFTVSPEHLKLFEDQVEKASKHYENLLGVKLNYSFSVQKPSTDTIAVDPDNLPFREDDGMLLFRPGGHGALIENLNDLDAGIVFIKNIDNIVPDRLKDETVKYKKVIGGLLLKLQLSVFAYLEELENGAESGRCDKIADFARTQLNITFPDGFLQFTPDKKKELLIHYLNRPIRVCGMVKNEGEPGGGPFWVKNSRGEISLQIVESSQIDMKNSDQVQVLKQATHFNPVDLVCGIVNYKGEHFNLTEFIDPETGFISEKSKNGRALKAQELPGLWNGAMADWGTLFVEVPTITFNPVKTVNDLLRPQHQPE
ncbi:MAG: DUF4301 family protein, partial [Bacteroidetes bacterium]|nr:DUF4301 family protein [Bacteroidota bacterium]